MKNNKRYLGKNIKNCLKNLHTKLIIFLIKVSSIILIELASK